MYALLASIVSVLLHFILLLYFSYTVERNTLLWAYYAILLLNPTHAGSLYSFQLHHYVERALQCTLLGMYLQVNYNNNNNCHKSYMR